MISMTNNELIVELSKKMGISQKKTSTLLAEVVDLFKTNLAESKPISIPGFGLFVVKKKSQRVSVNPSTQQRYLVPPKISVTFKPGNTIKETLRKLIVDE